MNFMKMTFSVAVVETCGCENELDFDEQKCYMFDAIALSCSDLNRVFAFQCLDLCIVCV